MKKKVLHGICAITAIADTSDRTVYGHVGAGAVWRASSVSGVRSTANIVIIVSSTVRFALAATVGGDGSNTGTTTTTTTSTQ
ncbi:exopolysaccharide production protein YjbE [Salmonella enterica]|uniref:exopolysaccharide production protein YjbE n=1 Tax=Salmonella enterica TaxID=28901 RepID=UPI00398C54AB